MTLSPPPSDSTTLPLSRPNNLVRHRADHTPDDERLHWLASVPFFALHLLPFLAVFTGVSWKVVALLGVTFFGRMFFITAGYHRYFSHRSYRLARLPQFVMAFGGTMAAQKGPLWWAAHHRDHHRYSDTDLDIHSPQKGFWWSQVGWILCNKYDPTKFDRIKDFARFPELRFLNRFDFIGPWVLAIACYLVAGWSGLLIGFFLSTVLLWHATFTINSLAHVIGRRRYATEDTSRNSPVLAVLTMGEGWHNNHHYYPASARQGFYWWEWDPSYYVLKGLSFVGIVKGLKVPSARVRSANRVKDGNFDIGMFRLSWNRAARAVAAAGSHLGHVGHAVHHGADHVGDALVHTRDRAGEALATTRASIGEGLDVRKAALEHFVHSSLESAEELARASRRSQREPATEAT